MPIRMMLSSFRRKIELAVAMYAGGLGLYIGFLISMFGVSPASWVSGSASGQLMFAQGLTLAALIHAIGISVNGSWRWSPMLRVVGISLHALMIFYAAVIGILSTAGYTYMWVFAILLMALRSAMIDALASLRG